ncbi:MAG TPA: hypothetical protein PK267_02155, partial [Atribacterota bacterium]|nr:hypothetical protein [Atribacterota bacterium]
MNLKSLPKYLLLISLAIVILLFTGCKGVVPSPGTTEDVTVIHGKIKMPYTCCTIEDPIFEDPIGHYTDEWSLIPEAIVELRDATKCSSLTPLKTTYADEQGLYEFKDMKPGLYIITAYCPVQKNNSYFLKDVAEKKAGVPLNAGIPDCDSTSLALVIEMLQDCFKSTNCFKLNSDIYKLAGKIAKDVGEISIPKITAHEDFGNLIDEDFDDLVDLVCDRLEGCCTSPGTTGGGGGGGPTPSPALEVTKTASPNTYSKV